MSSKNKPHRSKRDEVKAAIVEALRECGPLPFSELFVLLWAGPFKSIYVATTGSEMVRLRTYEFLQEMAHSGEVVRTGKQYELGQRPPGGEIKLTLNDVALAHRGLAPGKLRLNHFSKNYSKLDFSRAEKITFNTGTVEVIFKDRHGEVGEKGTAS